MLCKEMKGLKVKDMEERLWTPYVVFLINGFQDIQSVTLYSYMQFFFIRVSSFSYPFRYINFHYNSKFMYLLSESPKNKTYIYIYIYNIYERG